MYNQYNFNYLKQKISANKYVLVDFYFESKLPFNDAAHAIAGESSIGTWTKIGGLTKKQYSLLAPKITKQNLSEKTVQIAYPLALFEFGNIPQFLSSIGGNIFSMKVVDQLRLLQIHFPNSYINSFPGPTHGIKGIRKLLKITNRPIIGSIVKPKVGFTAAEQADAAYQLWLNGVDVVKDDENLTSMSFNNFDQRATKMISNLKKAEQKTGLKKMAIINITAPYQEALRRAKLIKKLGGTCMMVDVVAMGMSAIQALRLEKLNLVMHGHRAGHSMFTRNEKHGMTMFAYAQLLRLAGIDQLHTGTIVGKMDGTKNEIQQIDTFLHSDYGKLKPVMPIASGGLHPALITDLVKYLGQDVIINFGGGIFGHPSGVAAGAQAAKAAVIAASHGQELSVAAKNNKHLAEALAYWSNKK